MVIHLLKLTFLQFRIILKLTCDILKFQLNQFLQYIFYTLLFFWRCIRFKQYISNRSYKYYFVTYVFVVCAFRNYLPNIITLHHKLLYIQWAFISFHRNVFSENIMIDSKRMMIWLYNISNVFIKKSFKSYLRNVMHRYMILHTQSSILQTLTRFHLFFHRLLLMIYENIFFFY